MPTRHLSSAAILAASLLILAGCGKRADAPQSADAPATAGAPPVDAVQADADRTADIAARQDELQQREAELALKEKELELARREANLAQQEGKPVVKKPVATAKPAAPRNETTPATPAVPSKPVLVAVTVPSGTQVTVALSSDLSSKTAQPGDPFEARVVSDVMVNGKRAIPANARVAGSITDVISGSSRIGGIPTLGLRFDSLLLDDGQKVAINGELVEQGKSDTGRDTAKILGGAAAGAILGHQVKSNDGGKIIGGLLGGAIGAVAARKTGTEVQLAAGSQLTIALGSSFEVVPH